MPEKTSTGIREGNKRNIALAEIGVIAVAIIIFSYFALPMFFTNVSAGSTGLQTLPANPANNSISKITLQVQIPCQGHAPLSSGELKKISGIEGVQFSLPNYFEVSFNPAKTSKEQILAAGIFRQFPAKITAGQR
ncbi:MAG: hypothetical protein PHD95_02655 [Candidatus ainarchaeum sp.]|nr:hypothetical protein [Candidatus ainarchaeum sp.]MDD5163088.1 hypothetical protein [Candidatus ainarchaeum sp.]